jgi:hypothetical protein
VDAESRVADAVRRLLPRSQCRPVAGDEFAWVDGKRIHIYNVQVYLLGAADSEADGAGSGMLNEARKRLDKATSTEW